MFSQPTTNPNLTSVLPLKPSGAEQQNSPAEFGVRVPSGAEPFLPQTSLPLPPHVLTPVP